MRRDTIKRLRPETGNPPAGVVAVLMSLACGGMLGCPSGEAGPGATSAATVTASGTAGSTSGGDSSSGFDTIDAGTGDGTTAAPIVEVVCGEVPAAAAGADFQHSLVVTPADATWTWAIEGLPAGLVFSAISGEISGTPEAEGSFELAISVSGPEGEGETMCTLEVAESLRVDLGVLDGPCLGPADTLADVLVGGNGTPVTCETPAGSGNGARPDAVTVDPETCAIAGAATPEEFGTWVWITEVHQAGYRVHVPYCVTQDQPADGAFEVRVTASGDAEAALTPAVQSFEVGESLSYGTEGDPLFEILGGCGGGACFYGFNFSVGPSPFGECGESPCFSLAPSTLLRDADEVPIGFTHEMQALGGPVAEAFAGRPFVLPWDLTYCMADNDQDCDGSEAILANAGGRLHYSILVEPAG